MRSAVRMACLVALGALVSCANLSPMEAGVCGNGVIEPQAGEDCDSFPEGQCGSPDSDTPCRYQCETTTDCPSGWGCGEDAICRQATGKFKPAGTSQVPSGSQLNAGDFDGDGYTDVVVSSNQGVLLLFSDDSGDFTGYTGVPPSGYPPAVGDFNQDQLDDIALLYDGLILGRGMSDETIQPTVSSPYVLGQATGRAVLFDARPTEYDKATNEYSWLGDEFLLFLEKSILAVGAGELPIGNLPTSAGEIVGEVQVGDLYESEDDSPCEEVVVAFKDQGSIWVYTPCRVNGQGKVVWNEAPPPGLPINLPRVQLPQGTTASGVSLADLNGDGHLDMLIAADASANPEEPVVGMGGALVAYGNGTGTFHSNAATLPVAPAKGDNQATAIMAFLYGSPITAGDVDGDACADIVTPYAVFVTRPSCGSGVTSADDLTYRPIAAPSGITTWDYAAIADLNANGIPDVIAGSSALLELTFFNGAGSGVLNEFAIPLEGPADSVTIGDFDGDLISDVAFRQAGPHGNVATDVETGDALAVSFGNGFGAPSAPMNMGRLARIQHVASGNLAGFYADGIRDIVVMSKTEDESTTSLAVLPGASDRRMFSPFPFTLPDDNTPYAAVALAVGQFDGDPDGYPDVAGLTVVDQSKLSPTATNGGDVHLWLVPVSGDASLDAAAESRSDTLTNAYSFQTPLLRAVDLGSSGGGIDGIDELVALSTSYGTEATGALLVAHVEDVGGKMTWVAGPIQTLPLLFFGSASGLGGALPGVVTPGEKLWSYSGDLELGDVNADGAIDVVGLGLETDSQTGAWTGARIMLMLNDRTGSLDAKNAILLPNPDGASPTAIALLNADNDPELEIAVAQRDRGYVADIDVAAGLLVDIRPVGPMRGAEAVVSADFDADGIDDLAIATGDRAMVLLGEAVVQ